MKDYYLILGIEPNATTGEIKQAYRKMSMKYHPDKNQGDKYFEERFKDIGEAFEILTNFETRKQYDYQWMRNFSNKNDNGTNNSQESKDKTKAQDDNTHKQAESLKIKEQLLNDKEQKLNDREKGILIKEHKLNEKEVELNAREKKINKDLHSYKNQPLKSHRKMVFLVIFLGVLLLCVFAITYKLYNVSKENMGNVFKEKKISDHLFIKNNTDIDILDDVWEGYEFFWGTLHLKKVKVLNKTKNIIGSIKGTYEITDSNRSSINSGEFIINEPKGLSPFGERYFGDDQQIHPNMQMEFDLSQMHFSNSPDLKHNQKLILTIVSFDKVVDLDGE
jgi:curved DNA-binding protein CbpA